MKRCPQCEFIYEDDQSLCDMDGALLVIDSRSLPNFNALKTVAAPVTAKSNARNRVVPVMAALVLGTVLFLVYYVSTQRAPYSPPPNAGGESVSVPVPTPTIAEQPTESIEEPRATQPAAEAPAKTTTAAPAKKSSAKPAATQPPTTRQAPKKDDSKVNSILKKTGRILKKPFKF